MSDNRNDTPEPTSNNPSKEAPDCVRVAREEVESLTHPLIRSDDQYEMREAIAYVVKVLKIKDFTRPRPGILRIGRISYEPSSHRIVYDDGGNLSQYSGLAGLDLLNGELPLHLSSHLFRENDTPPTREALLALVDDHTVHREGDELTIGRITYHPDSGTIWRDNEREAPLPDRGLIALQALIYDQIEEYRRRENTEYAKQLPNNPPPREGDTTAMRAAIERLRAEKLTYQRPTAHYLRVAPLNFWPDDGNIYRDGDLDVLPDRGTEALTRLTRAGVVAPADAEPHHHRDIDPQ
jgi:hypothetical protein